MRNLKAGTDATLEDPKSPFLDFLYKNNCIRTQKKQKVFYWYSVPHDRLFLDALERDLKREKIGQDATTVAVAEPAVSFEFDSSQSLFEQLTKANSSSFATHASTAYGQPVSPVVRTVDAMPPPQMAPPAAVPILPEDPTTNPAMYTQIPMTEPPLVPSYIKREQPDMAHFPTAIARLQQNRHASVPTFVEYSPAPSFVSSQYDGGGYSSRGLSYEPITPPQHSAVPLGTEPAYIANEDTGLYSAIPDAGSTANLNPLSQMPSSTVASALFSAPPPPRPFAPVYSVLDGSPSYKSRRRRSSVTPGTPNGVAAAAAAAAAGVPTPMPYAVHKPSDLRRSVPSSVDPVMDGGAGEFTQSSNVASGYGPTSLISQKDFMHGMPANETNPPNFDDATSGLHLANAQDELPALPSGEMLDNFHSSSSMVYRPDRPGPGPGPIRRARSATVMELGPYQQKSHSCPIPSCGRLFKRLEHLKRYVSFILYYDIYWLMLV